MKMKDKKKEQIAARQAHLQKLQSAKRAKRKAAPKFDRPEPSKQPKLKILIVCEGENTEPSYFRQFKLSSVIVQAIGLGKETIRIIEDIIKNYNLNQYSEVWCVFDKDDFPDDDFDNAIRKAESHGIKVAYSNQAFEYWLILHFEDHQGGGMHRKVYGSKINGYIKPFQVRYNSEDDKLVSEELFDILFEIAEDKSKKRRVDLAIERAKRNYNRFDHKSPASEESSTTVFKLVERLLRL
jgi:hypothetical protein